MRHFRHLAIVGALFASILAFAAPAAAQIHYQIPCGSAAQSGGKCDPTIVADSNGQGVVVGYSNAMPVGNTTKQGGYTLTVTASSAYAAGNNIGSTMTFANQARSTNGTGLVQGAVLQFPDAQTGPFDLVVFNSSPANTYTDKTAIAMTTDVTKVIGVLHITDCTTLGTASACQIYGLALPYAINNVTSMYAQLVARGTPTFTTTAGPTVILKTLND